MIVEPVLIEKVKSVLSVYWRAPVEAPLEEIARGLVRRYTEHSLTRMVFGDEEEVAQTLRRVSRNYFGSVGETESELTAKVLCDRWP